MTSFTSFLKALKKWLKFVLFLEEKPSSKVWKKVHPSILFTLLIVGCWIWGYAAFGVFASFGTIGLVAFYFLTIFMIIEFAHFIYGSVRTKGEAN